MGVKNIVSYLNRNHMFTRSGGRWGIGQLHRVLTRRTYIGEHRFNRRSKKGEVKPEEEVVTVAVPPLIDLEIFEEAKLAEQRQEVLPHHAPHAAADGELHRLLVGVGHEDLAHHAPLVAVGRAA